MKEVSKKVLGINEVINAEACANVNISELEDVTQMIEPALEFVTNISIEANQFDMEKVYAEA